MDTTPRIWGGTTLAERQKDRRARLLAAGVTLIAAGGGQAVSVRAVCREAGLTSRYFYEHFQDRDELTVAVFQTLAEEGRSAIVDAVAAVAGSHDPRAVAVAAVEAVVEFALGHPARGQVLFVAPTTDPLLFEARERLFPIIAEMIADQIPKRDSADQRRLKSASLVGALGHDFFLYVGGQLDVPREVFVQHCVDLLLTVAAMGSSPR
ncbi:TetR/AcrR family transcriptional regulator [Nocardioides humilatus]|uniref:TetR/AcrR family transcriptional regulator n=1 Tax=Nocardioides humilatus TaxID=2607660 RepID=A0A5B1LF03_9ACTN|nr:TetR/AcrR family transcriptional regulator [Nocardioides humilatus]KAA1419311.1 TetR/AcrR family transcriptional regulator [Nocardioides humilatus]